MLGMSRDHAHLASTTVPLLDCPKAERIEAIHGDRWVTYPRARLILDVLETLLVRPRTTRMTSIAVYADSEWAELAKVPRAQRVECQRREDHADGAVQTGAPSGL